MPALRCIGLARMLIVTMLPAAGSRTTAQDTVLVQVGKLGHLATFPAYPLRLYGGNAAPLWSFPTEPPRDTPDGQDDHDDSRTLHSDARAEPATAPWVHAKQAGRRDETVGITARRPAEPPGNSARDAECKERRRQLAVARIKWWDADHDAADRAFLAALSWSRNAGFGSIAASEPSSSVDGINVQMQARSNETTFNVTPDGKFCWQRFKPLSKHAYMQEEANVMCEYAAFLFEAMHDSTAAEHILRCVHNADRMHLSAIDVLGHLLESEGRLEDAQQLYSRLPGLCVKMSRGSHFGADADTDGEGDEWFADFAPSKPQALPLTRLANLYELRRRREAAQQLLDLALDCDPQWLPALLLKAEIHAVAGQPHLAKPLLQTAIDAQPSPPQEMEALLSLAGLHAEHASADTAPARGDHAWSFEQAEALYQRAGELRVAIDSSVHGHQLVALQVCKRVPHHKQMSPVLPEKRPADARRGSGCAPGPAMGHIGGRSSSTPSSSTATASRLPASRLCAALLWRRPPAVSRCSRAWRGCTR